MTERREALRQGIGVGSVNVTSESETVHQSLLNSRWMELWIWTGSLSYSVHLLVSNTTRGIGLLTKTVGRFLNGELLFCRDIWFHVQLVWTSEGASIE